MVFRNFFWPVVLGRSSSKFSVCFSCICLLIYVWRWHLIDNTSLDFSPCVMHNGDRDGSPAKWSGSVSCGQWMMPMLWSGGRADKISNKLAGDVACLGGSMVEHQPRLLGSQVQFLAGAFAIFSVSAEASLPISLPFLLSPFPFSFPFLLSRPLPFPSSSIPFPSPSDLSFALKHAFFAFIPFTQFRLTIFCIFVCLL